MSRPLEIETDEQGRLVLTAEVLGRAQPFRRYLVARQGESLVLRPASQASARPDGRGTTWREESPRQRLAALRDLLRDAGSHAGLPDEAVSRDSIYD